MYNKEAVNSQPITITHRALCVFFVSLWLNISRLRIDKLMTLFVLP